MVHILSSVYNIYILKVVKYCLVNCSLMVKISLKWFQHIFNSDATNLKNEKFYVPVWFIFTGPVTFFDNPRNFNKSPQIMVYVI